MGSVFVLFFLAYVFICVFLGPVIYECYMLIFERINSVQLNFYSMYERTDITIHTEYQQMGIFKHCILCRKFNKKRSYRWNLFSFVFTLFKVARPHEHLINCACYLVVLQK